MKIAITGTRGIPNNYGGFEQFAECISSGLVKAGHQVTVYNPHFHEYELDNFNGVVIKRVYCPEHKMGSMAHFIYDYLCLKDALKQDYDIIYQAGYGTSAPALAMLKKQRMNTLIVTNMDGIEWKRSKWNAVTKKVMKWMEKVTVAKSDFLISDNKGIQAYYKEAFNRSSIFLAYGADLVNDFSPEVLADYHLTENEFYLLIARMEPENNIEMILEGYSKSQNSLPMIVVGNCKNKFGSYLKEKYQSNKGIIFLGAIYDKNKIDSLRHYSRIYFHGHSVGGTNPSLLEAMAAQAFIAVHQNAFNLTVIDKGAPAFSNSNDVKNIIENYPILSQYKQDLVKANLDIIKKEYSWSYIVEEHEKSFQQMIKEARQG